ncbi:hypothetical protein CLOM_g6495 [Closterium sp. NIES-68]|nr:hypothetical protein CLOM_g6495 [Closterium sp. NIES-68]
MAWLEKLNSRLESFLEVDFERPPSFLSQTSHMVESSVAQVGSGVRQLYGDLVRDLFEPAWDDDLFAAAAAPAPAPAAAATAPAVAPHSIARKRVAASSGAERSSKAAGRSAGVRGAEGGGRSTGTRCFGRQWANHGASTAAECGPPPSTAPKRASLPSSAQPGPPPAAAVAAREGLL